MEFIIGVFVGLIIALIFLILWIRYKPIEYCPLKDEQTDELMELLELSEGER